jgi:acyl carrier protein
LIEPAASEFFTLTDIEIRQMIAESCGIDVAQCHSDATTYSLGIDSLAMATLVARCEASFAAFDDLSLVRLTSAQTVGEVTAVIRSLTKPA